MTTLAAIPDLTEGHYTFEWDRNTIAPVVPLEHLRVRIVADQVDQMYPLRVTVPPPGAPRLPRITLDR